jgi:hypothetical protein
MNAPNFETDRDEMIVCTVIAFCLGNAALTFIYQVMS